jgi:cytochrome c-type biogenesis protein CcmH/NrfF
VRNATALAAAALVALTLAAGARPAEAQEQASLPDIEDEVMCPICGTPLEHSQAPQAERQRALIRRLIAEGRTKDEIKDALVADYGEEVLAVPDDEGFELSAWIVPPAAILLAGGAIALVLLRRPREAGETPAIDPADAERLDRELAEDDR